MRSEKKLNRHTSAFITFLTLIPLVYFIPELVEQHVHATKFLRVIVTVGIIVPIISYFVMPLSNKLSMKLFSF